MGGPRPGWRAHRRGRARSLRPATLELEPGGAHAWPIYDTRSGRGARRRGAEGQGERLRWYVGIWGAASSPTAPPPSGKPLRRARPPRSRSSTPSSCPQRPDGNSGNKSTTRRSTSKCRRRASHHANPRCWPRPAATTRIGEGPGRSTSSGTPCQTRARSGCTWRDRLRSGPSRRHRRPQGGSKQGDKCLQKPALMDTDRVGYSWRSGCWLSGAPQTRFTRRPRCTAGRLAIASVQRNTCVYSLTERNSPAS